MWPVVKIEIESIGQQGHDSEGYMVCGKVGNGHWQRAHTGTIADALKLAAAYLRTESFNVDDMRDAA